MKDDDTAALIERWLNAARTMDDDALTWELQGFTVDDMRTLAAALSRAQADAARMRNALQYARNLIGPDEIVDAALEPRP